MNIGKENERIEFKKSTSLIKEGIISISSILNKHGSGTLYFGVKDNGDVIGQEIGKETLRDVSRQIRDNIEPQCNFSVSLRNTVDNLNFIEIEFKGEDKIYNAYGKHYIRWHDEDVLMKESELEKRILEKRHDYSKWENDDSNVKINEVNKKLLHEKIKEGINKKRIPGIYKDDKTALTKFGLLYDNEKLNNAGYYLLAKNGPITVKEAVFATNTKNTFVSLDRFEGNIFECIDNVLQFIANKIDWAISFDGSAKRIETPEIPFEAIREIVINAFAHANYNSNTMFEINIYKDRITIYNPGNFPYGYTPEDFSTGRKETVMLNPKICNALYKFDEIESYGTGFERTFRLCKENKIEYEHEDTGAGFRFTFYRHYGRKKMSISKTEKAVLECLKSNNKITLESIATKIGKTSKTVYRSIAKLKAANLVERQGDNFNGCWIVKD